MKARLYLFASLILSFIWLISPITSLYADTVIRKDGRQIDGEIVEENEDWVVVKTKFGEATIEREFIEKVIRSKPREQDQSGSSGDVSDPVSEADSAAFNKRLAHAKRMNTADAYVDFAKWCRSKNIFDKAQDALLQAVKLDTDHAEARELLGYVQAGGKWMLESEARSLGYSEGNDGIWYRKGNSGNSEKDSPAAGKSIAAEYRRLLSEAEMKNTAAAFYELGNWCRSHGMEQEAEAAFRRTLLLDSKHAAANRALGLERVDGQWMTEREAKEAGYVRNSDGEWVKGDNYARKEEKRLGKERQEAEKLREEKKKANEGVPWDQRHRLNSKHYELHCNSSKETAEMYLRVMEALNKKYRKVFAALNPENRICRVYIHRNQQEFMQMQRKPRGVGGFYQPGRGNLVAFHGTFGMTGSTLTVLAHEGCHQFQDLFFKKGPMMSNPIWVLEGMAVIFESADIDPYAGKVELQGLNPDRVRQLQSMIKQQRHVTLERMLATPQSGFSGSHYCTAGAFTWWLLKASKKKKYRKLYENYLLALVAGKIRTGRGMRRGGSLDGGAFAKMCEDVTGKSIAELEKEWQEYVLEIKLPKYGYYSGDRFVSKQYKFEVERAGRSWKEVKEEELSGSDMMCWERGKTDGRFSVQCARNTIRASAESGMLSVPRQLAHAMGQDFKMLNKRKRYISGHAAIEFLYQYTGNLGGKSTLIKERRIIVYTSGLVYTTIASCADESWKKNERDFEKMEDSFRINTKS